MSGTAPWIALALCALVIDLAARRRWGSRAGLGSVVALLASRLPGRVALAALWVFAGIHLFARYTIPGR